VLEFNTASGYKLIIRPSGTEPKMKAYLSAVGKSAAEAEKVLTDIKNDNLLKF
jgi:phosphoglucomutase